MKRVWFSLWLKRKASGLCCLLSLPSPPPPPFIAVTFPNMHMVWGLHIYGHSLIPGGVVVIICIPLQMTNLNVVCVCVHVCELGCNVVLILSACIAVYSGT